MSIVPMAFRDWWDDFERPQMTSRLWDNSFGLGLRRDDLFRGGAGSYLSRPSWRRGPLSQGVVVTPVAETSADASTFSAVLDVQQFSPSELSVKVLGGAVVVEGKHEERQDEHGYVSRHFVRRYVMPESYDIEQVTSSLSSDGVLTITAPKKSVPGSGERVVMIQQTGVPAPKRDQPTVTIPQSPQPMTQ